MKHKVLTNRHLHSTDNVDKQHQKDECAAQWVMTNTPHNKCSINGVDTQSPKLCSETYELTIIDDIEHTIPPHIKTKCKTDHNDIERPQNTEAQSPEQICIIATR